MKDHQNTKHIPVLIDEVLHYLEPKKGETYLDLTAGYGGHASEVLGRTLQFKKSVLVDRDQTAVNELSAKFSKKGLQLMHTDFLTASWELLRSGLQFDLILADLGISSVHVDDETRGFSFINDGPLDMRMDSRQKLTAEHIVNQWPVEKIEQILRDYGEEKKAKKIAAEIVSNRPINTTIQLAGLVAGTIKGKWKKTHPATQTFQALRIAVNKELDLLEQALPLWFELLKPGGRIAIISFHSLEDRIVKQALKSRSGPRYDATMRLLTKKPVTSTQNESVINPRARSAKLRAAVKIKIEREANANIN
jgi:16S rRNA (cytosine1402-N4)-methyltransferase